MAGSVLAYIRCFVRSTEPRRAGRSFGRRCTGIAAPRRLLVHAHLTTAGGAKLSKSRANACSLIDTLRALALFDRDALRYFLLRHGGCVRCCCAWCSVVPSSYDHVSWLFGFGCLERVRFVASNFFHPRVRFRCNNAVCCVRTALPTMPNIAKTLLHVVDR